ncbi:DUF6143 family protein [Acetivibrio cellulolyticus]|uniref:DUF6143 family protein n=1 Tax=Acetivibrio cellulolyticus TaxID=35830 RepID=UPI0001E2D4A5|nr:DUF6143 family protein [Acetivibrio cellulolyticus]
MFEKIAKQPIEVVDITTPAMNSMLGRYFIAQTDTLSFGNKSDAWGGIINPRNSGVNLYFDIFTITNFSNYSFTGEIWLNAKPPKESKPASTVTPSNQAIFPPPRPKAIMEYANNITEPLKNGVNIFGRIVAPNSTLVSDSHKGSMIIGPGGSFSILLKSPGQQNITGTIVLTWWEEKIQ